VHGRCGRAQAYLDGEGGWVRSHTEGRTALLAWGSWMCWWCWLGAPMVLVGCFIVGCMIWT